MAGLSRSEPDADRAVTFTYDIDGQQRTVQVVPEAPSACGGTSRPVADRPEGAVDAPVAGVVVEVLVTGGGGVGRGDPLVVLEAMKLQARSPARTPAR